MYKIKQIPEDFYVKELNKLKLDKKGNYSYYLLKKRNYTTQKAVEIIAKKLRILPKYINFAGTKDKNAITEQYISISKGPKENLAIKDIDVIFLGKGRERLNLGELQGNCFEIVVRNIEKKPRIKKSFVNYFDEQRFGVEGNNHIVGKLIIKKKFKEACILLGLDEKNPVYSLKTIPKQILRMYVHAYQSYLWNILAKGSNEKTLPLIGFGTEGEFEILKKEDVDKRDFIIRQIPEISSVGGERDRIVKVKDLKISELEDDELNPGKKKLKICFCLPKGSYATCFLKQLF